MPSRLHERLCDGEAFLTEATVLRGGQLAEMHVTNSVTNHWARISVFCRRGLRLFSKYGYAAPIWQ